MCEVNYGAGQNKNHHQTSNKIGLIFYLFEKIKMEYVLSIIGVPEVSLKRAFAPLGDFARHIHDHFIPNHRNNYHPHILGHRSLALMSAVLVGIKIFTLAAVSFGPIAPVFSSAITEVNIINLTNESRHQYGLANLTQNAQLDKAAQAKADDMLAKGYFAHVTPDGHTPWDFIISAGYNYLMAGENLAVNFSQAEDVETAWMNSPGHKANILNRNFEEIGIGVSQGEFQGHTAIFVVQEFGTPSEQKVALSDKPTEVQTTAVPAPAASPAAVSPHDGDVKSSSQSQLAEKSLGTFLPKVSQDIVLQSGSVKLDGKDVDIIAEVTGPAVKVLAYFGGQAIMLSPKDPSQLDAKAEPGQFLWTGKVAASTLAQNNLTVQLKAISMNGQVAQMQLADFSANTQNNYNANGSTNEHYVSILNTSFDPKSFEGRFYLLFIAGILSSLILAIAIKRHIQHLPLIANGSFVIIFAALLFWAG